MLVYVSFPFAPSIPSPEKGVERRRPLGVQSTRLVMHVFVDVSFRRTPKGPVVEVIDFKPQSIGCGFK